MYLFLQVFGGIIFLILGGESIVRGSSMVAKPLRISPLIIGLTLVSYGTYSPDFFDIFSYFVANFGKIDWHSLISGNALHILSLIMIAALILPMAVKNRLVTSDGLMMMALAVFNIRALQTGNQSYQLQGLLLLLWVISYTVLVWKQTKEERMSVSGGEIMQLEDGSLAEAEQVVVSSDTKKTVLAVLLCILGMAALLMGAELFIKSSSKIASNFGFPASVYEVTLVALGTALPEICTAVIGFFRKHTYIDIGHIVKSNALLVLSTLWVALALLYISLDHLILSLDTRILLAVTAIMFILLKVYHKIPRFLVSLFVMTYTAYVATYMVM